MHLATYYLVEVEVLGFPRHNALTAIAVALRSRKALSSLLLRLVSLVLGLLAVQSAPIGACLG